MKAERLRGDLHQVAVDTGTAICTVLEPSWLSIGGGTVLAARWGHRRSIDIDFFCEPGAYAELDARKRAKLEEALRAVPGIEAETLWCDPIATWCTVRDTEVTILPRPRVRALAGHEDSYLDSTRIALQANAEVLFGKIARRMLQAEDVHVRDAYDIVYAAERDRGSLEAAIRFMGRETLENVAALIESLPRGWTRDQEKMLIEPVVELSEHRLRTGLLEALREGRGIQRDGGRGF